MKALVFRHSLPREALSAIGGRVDRRAFVSRIAPVRVEDVAEQPLPGPDWVRVETAISGLCGSDVKQILLNGSRDNPLTALVSFPHVLGHEAVGRRLDTGGRVVLNPWLSCVRLRQSHHLAGLSRARRPRPAARRVPGGPVR
jgi:threonine dehydrogenase-like Zn-dependent dehydrogenase